MSDKILQRVGWCGKLPGESKRYLYAEPAINPAYEDAHDMYILVEPEDKVAATHSAERILRDFMIDLGTRLDIDETYMMDTDIGSIAIEMFRLSFRAIKKVETETGLSPMDMIDDLPEWSEIPGIMNRMEFDNTVLQEDVTFEDTAGASSEEAPLPPGLQTTSPTWG